MPRPKKNPSDVASLAVGPVRLTPAEHATLMRVLDARGEALAAQDLPARVTFAEWVRWIIRREARALETPPAAPPAEHVQLEPPKRPDPSPRNTRKSSKR